MRGAIASPGPPSWVIQVSCRCATASPPRAAYLLLLVLRGGRHWRRRWPAGAPPAGRPRQHARAGRQHVLLLCILNVLPWLLSLLIRLRHRRQTRGGTASVGLPAGAAPLQPRQAAPQAKEQPVANSCPFVKPPSPHLFYPVHRGKADLAGSLACGASAALLALLKRRLGAGLEQAGRRRGGGQLEGASGQQAGRRRAVGRGGCGSSKGRGGKWQGGRWSGGQRRKGWALWPRGAHRAPALLLQR